MHKVMAAPALKAGAAAAPATKAGAACPNALSVHAWHEPERFERSWWLKTPMHHVILSHAGTVI